MASPVHGAVHGAIQAANQPMAGTYPNQGAPSIVGGGSVVGAPLGGAPMFNGGQRLSGGSQMPRPVCHQPLSPPCGGNVNVIPEPDAIQGYAVDHQMPPEFFQERICEGGNCPQPTHIEVEPGVYKSIANPEDIIYANAVNEMPAGVEIAPSVRMSGGSQMPMPRQSNGRRSQGSHMPEQLAQQGNGQNNIIVAAAIQTEQPQEAEQAAEAPAPEPKEEARPEKKSRRGMFRRKRNKRGADEGNY